MLLSRQHDATCGKGAAPGQGAKVRKRHPNRMPGSPRRICRASPWVGVAWCWSCPRCVVWVENRNQAAIGCVCCAVLAARLRSSMSRTASVTRSSTGLCSSFEASSNSPTSLGARHSVRENGILAIMLCRKFKTRPIIIYCTIPQVIFDYCTKLLNSGA